MNQFNYIPYMSCHHHEHIEIFSGFGEFGVIITLFLTGLVGSFSHCIFMCGPIALGISNMRLIAHKGHSLTEWKRLSLVLCLPYYLGKALTYAMLASVTYILAESLRDFAVFRYITILTLFLMSASFVMMGLSRSTSLGIKIPSTITNIFARISKGSSYGIKGFVQGIVLGLIPCGLVISSITTAVSYSDSMTMTFYAMFAFGMATFPALFVVSYFGSYIQSKLKGKFFSLIFATVMLLNAYLLVRYALKLI